jgi:drug/metabolite transporter (DMT)-like permease
VKKTWLPLFIIILLGSIWGSSFILIKRGLLAFEPIQVAGLRQFLAGIVLVPWVIQYSLIEPRKKRDMLISAVDAPVKLTTTDYANLFLSGIIGNGIPAFLFSYAGTLIPSGLSGIMNAFTPMFTLLLGVVFFKDHFTRNGLLGIIAGITGAVVLLAPGFLFDSSARINPAGALMVLSAAMMYGYNINLIKHRMHHLPAMVKTAYPFFFMGTLYLMILLGTGILKKWDTNPTQAWESFGYLILLGVVGSAISMIIFNILIKHTSALVASTNTFIIPVVAVLWGVYDHETLTWNMFVGLGLSLAGIYLIMRKDNHLPATEEDVTDLKEF